MLLLKILITIIVEESIGMKERENWNLGHFRTHTCSGSKIDIKLIHLNKMNTNIKSSKLMKRKVKIRIYKKPS